jgi:type III restriction enzyme
MPGFARDLFRLNLLGVRPVVTVFRRSLDHLIRLKSGSPRYLILETKGFDELEEVKRAAAERWVAAVNAEGSHGAWRYAVVKKVSDVDGVIGRAVANE